MRRFFQIYLVPGLVFQSVLIGGGYGTGREIVEFFLSHGPVGGLLALAVTAMIWCTLLAVSFEFARITKAYNYRSFFRELIGPFWRLFEVVYLLIALLVLAVIGSAAGEIAHEIFGAPALVGSVILLGGIAILAYFGSSVIEGILSLWSVVLYLAYATLFVLVASKFGGDINEQIHGGDVTGGWLVDGTRYAAYNFVVLAPLLFVLRHIETRRQALTSGVLASIIGLVPAVLLFAAMLVRYPDILEAPVPVSVLLRTLESTPFVIVFQVILFGTFIETGAGIVHSINERISAALMERGEELSRGARFAVAVAILGVALFLADRVGIITLIAHGHGAMSYVFIAVVILPLITVGLYRIFTKP